MNGGYSRSLLGAGRYLVHMPASETYRTVNIAHDDHSARA